MILNISGDWETTIHSIAAVYHTQTHETAIALSHYPSLSKQVNSLKCLALTHLAAHSLGPSLILTLGPLGFVSLSTSPK